MKLKANQNRVYVKIRHSRKMCALFFNFNETTIEVEDKTMMKNRNIFKFKYIATVYSDFYRSKFFMEN